MPKHKTTVEHIAPFPFRYGQYRDRVWWKKVKSYCLDNDVSINELLVKLLDDRLQRETPAETKIK